MTNALDNRRTPGSAAGNQYGTFEVKYGSAAQIKFARRLSTERDTTGLTIPADFAAVNKRALSDWIDTLLSRPEVTVRPAATLNAASEKQVAFLTKLIGEKNWEDLAGGNDAALIRSVQAGEPVDRRQASSTIDWLMSLSRKAPAGQPVDLEDGMYFKDGVILKVYHTVHGANQQVAKRLCTDVIAAAKEAGTLDQLAADDKWEYLGKRGLAGLTATHRMSLEQAKELGAVYGVCVRCAATLTNEVSIEAAMGPVCRGKI